jgi:hypothetical protein
MMKNILNNVIVKLISKILKTFDFCALIIQKETSIKYLYLNNMIIKIIFLILDVTKKYFDDRIR